MATNKIKTVSLLLVLVLPLILTTPTLAKESRKINKLIVDDYYENQMQLSLLAPQDYWVLVVVDSNLSSSHNYIRQLQQQKVDLSSAVIVLLNSNDSKEVFYKKYHTSLQPYSWVNAQGSDVLTQMKISATPVIIGMHKDVIKWQNSGQLNSFDEVKQLSKQLKSWTNQKVGK